MIRSICIATTAVLLTMSATAATARNSDHSELLLGPSHLTCDKFNKLAKAEKERVMAWAMGYVSGMATSEAEEVRMERQSGEGRARGRKANRRAEVGSSDQTAMPATAGRVLPAHRRMGCRGDVT
jgi:HdeA/HdeB family